MASLFCFFLLTVTAVFVGGVHAQRLDWAPWPPQSQPRPIHWRQQPPTNWQQTPQQRPQQPTNWQPKPPQRPQQPTNWQQRPPQRPQQPTNWQQRPQPRPQQPTNWQQRPPQSPQQPTYWQQRPQQPTNWQRPSQQPTNQRPQQPTGHRQSFAELPVLDKNSYCNIANCVNHTVCNYAPTNATECGKVESNRLTDDEVQEILDKHNEFRRKVASGNQPGQPAARNIKPLTWNKELAAIAQVWANQCKWQHDTCRNTKTSTVGQNLAYGAYSDGYSTSLSSLITGWYNEVEKFNPNEVTKFLAKSPGTGHYTQLIWAKTTEVGCGVIRFNDPVTSKGYYRTQLVCNYAPAGNMIGQPVYLRA